MTGWRTINEPPADRTAVLLYFARLAWDGASPMRLEVERHHVGWFADGQWFEMGTGHDIFEDWRALEDLPTHWMPLPPAPETAEASE